MDHLNVTLNFVISVNHNSTKKKKKKKTGNDESGKLHNIKSAGC